MNNPALKDIGQIARQLGVSPLSQSALWQRPVHDISLVHITAFLWRMKEAGKRDAAESALEVAMTEITRAVGRNEIGVPPMLAYKRPNPIHLTAGELRKGLEFVGQPKASAILFALETGMNATGVASLTWRKYKTMTGLSALAREASSVCPRHFRCEYVFWTDATGVPLPVFGLDHAVFEAFGLLWNELAEGYRNLIMVDGEADAAALKVFLER